MASIERLKKGDMLPDLRLPAATGEGVRLDALRGRRNLVLFLSHPPGCAACEEKLRELSAASGDLRKEEAEVLAVVPGPAAQALELMRRLALSFQVLVDTGNTLGGGAAMVVADRFGEVFAADRAGEDHRLPTAAEIAEELAFIGVQCPE